MNKLNFTSDYAKGTHPKILEALSDINDEAFDGYGRDRISASAEQKIKDKFECPNGKVFFLAGGTQTNETVISTMLKPFEGVISATTGHINAHEAGAVEYTGHKVLTVSGHLGKIDAGELKAYIKGFFEDGNHEHMVYPGMVYISYPTEYGTLYSKKELTDIHGICREYNIPLFIDGARLGYGLMSNDTDVTAKDISDNCEVFYVGGTKVGALFGEAVVFPTGDAPKGFYTMTKQHGAMLAKGWLLGLMFDTLFTDDLYFNISKEAIQKAEKLKKLLLLHGFEFHLDSPTNQQFVVVEDAYLAKLMEKVSVGFWEKKDDTHTVVRFATSWYTKDSDLDALDRVLCE